VKGEPEKMSPKSGYFPFLSYELRKAQQYGIFRLLNKFDIDTSAFYHNFTLNKYAYNVALTGGAYYLETNCKTIFF
jgi:hypothetical protein